MLTATLFIYLSIYCFKGNKSVKCTYCGTFFQVQLLHVQHDGFSSNAARGNLELIGTTRGNEQIDSWPWVLLPISVSLIFFLQGWKKEMSNSEVAWVPNLWPLSCLVHQSCLQRLTICLACNICMQGTKKKKIAKKKKEFIYVCLFMLITFIKTDCLIDLAFNLFFLHS